MKLNLICLMLSLVVVAACAKHAGATPPGWPNSEFNNYAPSKPKTVKRRRTRPRTRPSPITRPKPKKSVAGAAFQRIGGGFVCASERAITGSVKVNIDRAKDSAWTMWHSAVKFDLGERFADDRFAKDIAWQCARSKSDTLVGKTAEALGGSVTRFRCRLFAKPCMPPRSE